LVPILQKFLKTFMGKCDVFLPEVVWKQVEPTSGQDVLLIKGYAAKLMLNQLKDLLVLHQKVCDAAVDLTAAVFKHFLDCQSKT
jgi:hypothetical protein